MAASGSVFEELCTSADRALGCQETGVVHSCRGACSCSVLATPLSVKSKALSIFDDKHCGIVLVRDRYIFCANLCLWHAGGPQHDAPQLSRVRPAAAGSAAAADALRAGEHSSCLSGNTELIKSDVIFSTHLKEPSAYDGVLRRRCSRAQLAALLMRDSARACCLCPICVPSSPTQRACDC